MYLFFAPIHYCGTFTLLSVSLPLLFVSSDSQGEILSLSLFFVCIRS